MGYTVSHSYNLRIQFMDMMNVNRIKQEQNNTSQEDFPHNWNLSEIKMEQDDGLHINQENVDDQNEEFQIKENSILQWDDSPGDAQLKEKDKYSKAYTIPTHYKTDVETDGSDEGIQTLQTTQLDIKQETVDDQNEIFPIKQECILQWGDSPGDMEINEVSL